MRFCVFLSSGLVLSTILLACGGATAPAIGDGDAASSGNGSGSGAGPGSGDTGGGGGGGVDAAVDPVDSGLPDDDPDEGDSDPGLIGCGATKCKSSGGVLGSANASYCCVERSAGGPISTCKNAAVSSCNGHRFLCDEAADCTSGVCCVEVQTSGGTARALSACRSSCATGATRFQVCKTDDECEGGGSCKAYDCGSVFPGLRFCQKPDGCK